MEKRGDLGDFLFVILKRRRFIVWNTVIVSSLVMAGSFLLPVKYTSTATLLPPREEGGNLLGLGTLLQRFNVSQMELSGATSSAQIYLAVLKSRTVADAVVEQFDLQERYKAKNHEAARRALNWSSDFGLTSSGVIEVSVEDRDPQMAADMANAIVDHLDRINRNIEIGDAKRTRVFVEERLQVTQERLQAAEESLLTFKESYPGVVLPSDIAVSAAAGANLMAQRIVVGTELEVLESTLRPGAPALLRKQREVIALDRVLMNLPVMELELGRRLRDFKIQETVFELLTSQFEEARIREYRDVATVDVLDSAVPPLRKSSPRRGIMTIAAFFFSLLTGLVIVVSQEALALMKLAQDPRFRSVVRSGSLLDRVLFGRKLTKVPDDSP